LAERLLLDTHTLIWWTQRDRKLSAVARAAIVDTDNEVYVSPVTAMEICTKVRIGKLDEARALATNFAGQMQEEGFVELPLTLKHSEMAGGFEAANNDPWDRLLVAQAQLEGLTLVSCDAKLDGFDVDTLW
jgi:PIN domain nuclease of toxin-antitoxin system